MAVSGSKVFKGLSSTMSRGSGEDFDLICQPCDRDDLRVQAFGFCRDCEEHLCESCFKHHKRAKPSKHHILADKQHMPQTQQFSTSVSSGQSGELTRPCPKHMKEAIKFYCCEHRALLCNVCVTLEHTRTACRINYIPDISEESVNSKEYRHILKSMDILTQKCHEITADLKQMTVKSSASLTGALAEVRKFRHDINERLDELEKLVEDKAMAIQQENDINLQTAEATCNDVVKSLKASADVIQQLKSSKQADTLFMELKSAEQIIHDNENNILGLTSPDDLKEYHFQPNSEISACLKTEKCLGTLIQKTAKPSITSPAAALRALQFSHQGDINVKTPQDKDSCWISRMAFSMPSKIFLADYSNQSVKMFDINSNSITHQLVLGKHPREITTVTSQQLAVTLPEHEEIQFIYVASNRMSLKHTQKVDGKCLGISCYQQKLVVTFVSPPKLEIIDLKGKTLNKITTNSRDEHIFGLPHHVTSNSNSIYVDNMNKHKVFMLSWQGELLGSYGGMDGPRGITMLEDGSIFASEYNKGNIHHMSGDLTKGKVVLKDIGNASAVCWCGANSQLYISYLTRDDTLENVIQFFKMNYK